MRLIIYKFFSQYVILKCLLLNYTQKDKLQKQFLVRFLTTLH